MTVVIIPQTNPDFTQIDDVCEGTQLICRLHQMRVLQEHGRL